MIMMIIENSRKRVLANFPIGLTVENHNSLHSSHRLITTAAPLEWFWILTFYLLF